MQHLIAKDVSLVSRTLDSSNLVLDGDAFLRAMRLPYYTIANLRKLRVGEGFYFFDFVLKIPSSTFDEDNPPFASASVVRERGRIEISAMWFMLPTGKHDRATIISSIEIKLLPRRKFQILLSGTPSGRLDSLNYLIKVFRYAHRFSQMARAQGHNEYAETMAPHVHKPDKEIGANILYFANWLRSGHG